VPLDGGANKPKLAKQGPSKKLRRVASMKAVKSKDKEGASAAPKADSTPDIFSAMQQQGRKQTRRDLEQAEGALSPGRAALRGIRVAPAAEEAQHK
jgi:hypothetical protein